MTGKMQILSQNLLLAVNKRRMGCFDVGAAKAAHVCGEQKDNRRKAAKSNQASVLF
jgi:hypothetical protein